MSIVNIHIIVHFISLRKKQQLVTVYEETGEHNTYDEVPLDEMIVLKT